MSHLYLLTNFQCYNFVEITMFSLNFTLYPNMDIALICFMLMLLVNTPWFIHWLTKMMHSQYLLHSKHILKISLAKRLKIFKQIMVLNIRNSHPFSLMPESFIDSLVHIPQPKMVSLRDVTVISLKLGSLASLKPQCHLAFGWKHSSQTLIS